MYVLADHLTGNADAITRFDQEMKMVGRLCHPTIVRATDAGEHDGKHYLAMKWVDGHDLSHVMRADGRLCIGDASEAVWQATVGIRHAHENGLIHRDWDDASEQISTNQALPAGETMLGFVVPAGATSGTPFARIGLSSNGGLTPRGLTEDVRWKITSSILCSRQR